MGKIISVSNQKGGVGKTTTAINLSAGLAEHGHKVLLIDTDAQGNSTSGLGINRENISLGLHDAIIDEFPLIEIIIDTGYDNFHAIPSTRDLSGVDAELFQIERRERRLKEGLHILKQEYDYIIIDCPPSLTLLTVNALTAADSVLIPLQTEYYALEGLGQLLGAINLIRLGLNPDLAIEGIVLTMFDKRTRLSMQVVNEVQCFFRDREYVFDTIIPRNVRLSEAPSYGKPALYYDPSSIGAQAYRALSKEFLKKQAGMLSVC
ncbi:MAG: AAA family ATPase [Candidatus Auribacterota bacterium]|jgi:chromosome partitioning protein|nr:AAA family ATPase [Candidatus Auribacterota bacterium]